MVNMIMILSRYTRKLYDPSIFLPQVRKMSKCTVAVCQLTATNNKTANLEIVKGLVKQAADRKAKVIFLPEASDFIATNKAEARQLAESIDGHLMNEYKAIAKQNDIWLSIGGFHEKIDQATIYNSHILLNNNGEVQSIYRKIHLFDVAIPEKNVYLRESDINIGGSQILLPVETPAGKLGLAICYDLRFPELAILQTKLGAQILTYPSAFTQSTGEAHWEVLLRARAIENQCYVVAAAQFGKHNNKRKSYGQAMIVDPWGKIVAECPKFTGVPEQNESIAIADVDIDLLSKIRLEMPVQQHRRHDIYDLSIINWGNEPINDTDTYKFADKVILGSYVFFKTKYCYAFTNIRCVVPGHVLITTLRPAQRLVDLSQHEIADLFQTTIKVQRGMETEHKASSSTVCVQDGPSAGQTVAQVHVHILPRKSGDFQRNDDIYIHLAKHDRDENSQPMRTPNEMAQEARKLRQYFL